MTYSDDVGGQHVGNDKRTVVSKETYKMLCDQYDKGSHPSVVGPLSGHPSYFYKVEEDQVTVVGNTQKKKWVQTKPDCCAYVCNHTRPVQKNEKSQGIE